MSQSLKVCKNSPPSTNAGLEKIIHSVKSDIEKLESSIISDIKTDIPLLNNVNAHIIGSVKSGKGVLHTAIE